MAASEEENKVKWSKFLKYSLCSILYLMAGGCLFFFLESCTMDAVASYAKRTKSMAVKRKKLCQIIATVSYNISRNLTSSELKNCSRHLWQEFLTKEESQGLKLDCKFSWNTYSRWIQFCGVTVTTIGYGQLTPKTNLGKMVVIWYALVGIPLIIQTYTLAGRIIQRYLLKIIRKFEAGAWKSDQVKYQDLKLFLTLIALFVIVILSAGGYSSIDYFHGLTFIDGIYFWFVSLSTIGYGDITTPPEKYVKNPYLIILDDAFSVFGLGIMAATVDSFIRLVVAIDSRTFSASPFMVRVFNSFTRRSVDNETATNNTDFGLNNSTGINRLEKNYLKDKNAPVLHKPDTESCM